MDAVNAELQQINLCNKAEKSQDRSLFINGAILEKSQLITQGSQENREKLEMQRPIVWKNSYSTINEESDESSFELQGRNAFYQKRYDREWSSTRDKQHHIKQYKNAKRMHGFHLNNSRSSHSVDSGQSSRNKEIQKLTNMEINGSSDEDREFR